MTRRLLWTAAAALLLLLVAALPASARMGTDPVEAASGSPGRSSQATTTTNDLPLTSLEAEQRDDGDESVAPWVIGSGIVALLAIGAGGTVLKRYMD